MSGRTDKGQAPNVVALYRATLLIPHRGQYKKGDTVTLREGNPNLDAFRKDPRAWQLTRIGSVTVKGSAEDAPVNRNADAAARKFHQHQEAFRDHVAQLTPGERVEFLRILEARPATEKVMDEIGSLLGPARETLREEARKRRAAEEDAAEAAELAEAEAKRQADQAAADLAAAEALALEEEAKRQAAAGTPSADPHDLGDDPEDKDPDTSGTPDEGATPPADSPPAADKPPRKRRTATE